MQNILTYIMANVEQTENGLRKMKFSAKNLAEAQLWQKQAKQKLFEIMMGGGKPDNPPLNPELIKVEEVPDENYHLEEMMIESLPDRKVHAWVAMQKDIPQNGCPVILGLHGHGGKGEWVVKGDDGYWFGKALAQKGYIVISLDIASHDLQHKEWTLMGQRTWDAMTCLDYICTRPEVDKNRIGTAGVSLGGETVMYVAALDERIKVAVSAGWLTTTENMKDGHCKCWNYRGLEDNFDFSDIFACFAPRYLVTEIGIQEKAPDGFPVSIAEVAFKEIQEAYRVFGAEDKCLLDIHDGGHEFRGKTSFEWIDRILKTY
jgi:hypothetical protein